jgi:hypothetical protein
MARSTAGGEVEAEAEAETESGRWRKLELNPQSIPKTISDVRRFFLGRA